MDKIKVVIYLLYFLIVLFDTIIISDARRLLLDFLIGQRNRKNAMQIHSEQTFKSRVHMGYIHPMLKKHQKTFKKYHMLYLVILYSLVPQYATIVLVHVFVPGIFKYVMGAYLIVRLILAVFYRLELGPQKISVYASKKKLPSASVRHIPICRTFRHIGILLYSSYSSLSSSFKSSTTACASGRTRIVAPAVNIGNANTNLHRN